jgi:hypothetical protein
MTSKTGEIMDYKEISKEAFSLGLRFWGIALLFQGITFIHSFITSLIQHFTMDTFRHHIFRALYIVPAVLIGFWFLRGAPKLISYTYPKSNQDQSPAGTM